MCTKFKILGRKILFPLLSQTESLDEKNTQCMKILTVTTTTSHSMNTVLISLKLLSHLSLQKVIWRNHCDAPILWKRKLLFEDLSNSPQITKKVCCLVLAFELTPMTTFLTTLQSYLKPDTYGTRFLLLPKPRCPEINTLSLLNSLILLYISHMHIFINVLLLF